MERNSVIVERLEKTMCDKLTRTDKYERQVSNICKLEKEFLKLINGDEQIVKKYLAIESITSENNFEHAKSRPRL